MRKAADIPTGSDAARVLLVGGRPALWNRGVCSWIPAVQQTVRMPYGAGYEHLERDGRTAGTDPDALIVLHWHGHTKIAE